MSNKHKQPRVVISVYPTTSGLGFCVFDGPSNLVEWGVGDIRQDKEQKSLKKLASLFKNYEPDLLVLEGVKPESSRRHQETKALVKTIAKFAKREKVSVQHYDISDRDAALPADNKHIRATTVSETLPELIPYLPPERKIWKAEHYRMQIFEAIFLALTFFYFET